MALQTGAENNKATVYPESGNEYDIKEIKITVHEHDSPENKVETSPGIEYFFVRLQNIKTND